MNDIEQRTEEWFKARLGKATASRFSEVMATIRSGEAAQRKNYRAQLTVERLTGQKADSYTSPVMQWGIDNEPVAKIRYEILTGNEAKDAPFVQHEVLLAGASPDGYVDADGLIEIKCPSSATHIETLKSAKIPGQYTAQVQGQMWITGREWCDFVSFDPRMPKNAQLFITRVYRDNDYITSLEEEVDQFLDEVASETQFLKSYGGKHAR